MKFVFCFAVVLATLFGLIYGQLAPITREDQLNLEFAPSHYNDLHICVYLSAQGVSPYNYWTCGVPYKQSFCGTQTSFVYDCCPGYRNIKGLTDVIQGSSRQKCAEVESVWRMLDDSLREYHKMNFFADAILNARLTGYQSNTSLEIYTLFAPYVQNAGRVSNPIGEFNGAGVHPIRMHVARNRYYSHQFKNKAVITSEYNKQKLKVTTYSSGLVFIECRALLKPDIEARNGVVHYIAGRINPHVGAGFNNPDVSTALERDFSAFYSDIPSDVKQLLRDKSNQFWFTIFAPSNSQWNNNKAKYGSSIGLVVRNHILKKMICLGAIIRRSTSLGPTLAGEYLGVDCRAWKDQVVLDGCGNSIKIAGRTDVMAGNGVIHEIDGVLAPYGALELNNVVSCMGSLPAISSKWQISNFQSAISSCGINLSGSSKYVILVPTNGVYSGGNCDRIKNHILKIEGGGSMSGSWWNGQSFRSEAGSTVSSYYVKYSDGSKLFFNGLQTHHLVPYKFSQGYIYIVNGLSAAPANDIRSAIGQTGYKLDTIIKHLGSVGYWSDLGTGKLFLAWRNKGWSTRQEAKWGSDRLRQLFKLHTINFAVWGGHNGYLHPETEARYMSAYGKVIIFRRNMDGNIFVGYDGLEYRLWAMVLRSNIYTNGGMLWIIDWPLPLPA